MGQLDNHPVMRIQRNTTAKPSAAGAGAGHRDGGAAGAGAPSR